MNKGNLITCYLRIKTKDSWLCAETVIPALPTDLKNTRLCVLGNRFVVKEIEIWPEWVVMYLARSDYGFGRADEIPNVLISEYLNAGWNWLP